MQVSKLNKTLLVSLLLAGTSVTAFAHQDDDYEDRARVISVTPQVERVNTPRQECRTEYQRESYYENRDRSPAGAIIGGVTGGLLGSTIGRGNGRVAAAAVGAGVGAIVGDRVGNDDRRGGYERVQTRPVERCVTVDNWQTVNRGYLVQYEYNGRRYTTETDQDPGRFIPVHVSVRPSGYVDDVVYKPGSDWRRGRGHGREHGFW